MNIIAKALRHNFRNGRMCRTPLRKNKNKNLTGYKPIKRKRYLQ